MEKYYVTAESWGADYAPENWEEIAAEINGKIDAFCEECDDPDAVADYAARLWEEYCNEITGGESCKLCSFGNPCLGCEDYNTERGCTSDGACGRERREINGI